MLEKKKAVPAAPSVEKLRARYAVQKKTTITLRKSKAPLAAKKALPEVRASRLNFSRVKSARTKELTSEVAADLPMKKKEARVWARDKWYKCYYCKVPKQGKFNLMRHHYQAHRQRLAADLKKNVGEVEALFSEEIRNDN